MSRTRASLLLGLLLAATAAAASSDDTDARMRQLEQRIEELEAAGSGAATHDPEGADRFSWTRRVRLSGTGGLGFFGGGDDSVLSPDSFDVWDARFFLDAELGEAIRAGRFTVARNVGLSFEWNLVRIGFLANAVGDLYVDFQGIADSSWLSLQVGRFQIPVGETYLRYGKGSAENPFVSQPAGGPWYWDEGVRLYGSRGDGRFGYVASVSDGDTPFNVDSDSDKQVTLKLFVKPTDWLHLSVSGLRSGRLGSGDAAASGALWLGETWARPVGADTAVPSYVNGAPIAAAPNVLRDSYLAAADAVIDLPERLRLWLAYGFYRIDADSPHLYDRDLHYWIAELVLDGAMVSGACADLFLGLRGDAIGTYSSSRGYRADARYGGSLGYNVEAQTAIAAVLGWRPSRYFSVRGEYRHVRMDFVDGVPLAVRDAGRDADSYAAEVRFHF